MPIAGPPAALLMSATLLVFGWIGWSARRSATLDDYVGAPDSQRAGSLALSFFASGMGAWILFAPPEVGYNVGAVGVAGYAAGAAAVPILFGTLGGRIRAALPEGHSITSLAGARFGTGFSRYVTWISVAYMLVFLTAELTAIAAITAIATPLDPRIAVVAVAGVTALYTASGGLRASLVTDRWQAWAVVALVAIALPALMVWASEERAITLIGRERIGGDSLQVALTLIIAVAAANVFHEGYWQRVRSAVDARSLARAGVIAGAMIVPLILLLGWLGVIAWNVLLDVGTPPAPLFAIATELPAIAFAVILVLGLSLVASSIDTLQNGLVSLASGYRRKMTVPTARLVTVGVTIPPAIVALQGHSVLRLFLIADLICACTAIPVLSGLSRRATARAAIAGAIAGPIGTIAPLWISTGSIGETIARATFEGAIPTLAPFLGALVASGAVTILGARLSAFRSGSERASN